MPEEPTAWELMRALERLSEQLARMEQRMLTVDVFKAYQEATERRFQEVEKDQQAWTVESRGEHVRLDGEIKALNIDLRAQLDTYKVRQDDVERAQRESRTRNWLSIGLAVFAVIGSIGIAVLNNALGGP